MQAMALREVERQAEQSEETLMSQSGCSGTNRNVFVCLQAL